VEYTVTSLTEVLLFLDVLKDKEERNNNNK
jgi:hypothetical protein